MTVILDSPYGIAPYPSNSSRLLVADWGSNRTVVMQVNWTTGQVKMERNLTKYSPVFLNGQTDFENYRVPYPFRLAASKDNLAVISMVCCETWQVTKIHQFTTIITQFNMILFPGTIAGSPSILAPLWRTNQDGEAA